MTKYFPLDDLPDLFLVRVMARMPLDELVRLNQVSTKWRCLQRIALRRITRLDIMIGSWYTKRILNYNKLQDIECIQLDRTVQERHQLLGLTWIDPMATLTLASLDQDKLKWLTKSMPGIRTLTIVQGEVDAEVTTMVNHWANSLTSLNVQSCQYMSPEQYVQLFNSINRLPSLQDLTLKLYRLNLDELDLPILSRIRRFVFYSGSNPTDGLLNSLRRYATNNNLLEQIHLDNYAFPYMPAFLDLDQSVTSKITSLIFRDIAKCKDRFLPEICTKFRSLTYLYLNVRKFNWKKLVAALVNLPQLYYLELDLHDATKWLIDFESTDHERDYAIKVQEGAQLASIQVVCIDIGFSANHQDFAHMYNWPWTFPSLRVVNVKELGMFGCGPCGISGQMVRTSHCTRQLLSPFTDCPLLHKIAHDGRTGWTRWDGHNWTHENGDN